MCRLNHRDNYRTRSESSRGCYRTHDSRITELSDPTNQSVCVLRPKIRPRRRNHRLFYRTQSADFTRRSDNSRDSRGSQQSRICGSKESRPKLIFTRSALITRVYKKSENKCLLFLQSGVYFTVGGKNFLPCGMAESYDFAMP